MSRLNKLGDSIKGIFKKHRKLVIGCSSMLLAVMLVLSGMQLQWLPIGSNQHNKVLTIGRGEFILTISTAEAATVTDYTCNGLNDSATFQTAVDALPSTGGKLEVLGGNYVFTATVSRAINNVTIEGVGASTNFTYNASSAIFSAGSQSGWVFKDFLTDAGGITVSSATNYLFSNIWIGTTYYGVSGLQTNLATVKYIVGVNSATDDVYGSTGYWVKQGSNGKLLESTSDNVADDDIQYAIDLVSGSYGTVHLTSGVFYISDNISVCQYLTLEGEGHVATTIYLANGSNNNMLISPVAALSQITIKDLILDANRTNQTSQGRGIYFSTNATTGLIIRDIWVQCAYGESIYINNIGWSMTIDGCTVRDSGGTGIYFGTSVVSGVVVRDCVVEAGAHGIFLESQTANWILNNNIDTCTSNGIRLVATKNTVTGNYVTSCTIGIYAYSDGNIIANNRISNCSSVGISVSGLNVDNVVEGNYLYLLHSAAAISTDGASRVNIIGNVIEDSVGGIWVTASSHSCTIESNIVYNPYSDASGIYVLNSDNANVLGNHVYDTRSGASQKLVYGVRLYNSSNSNVQSNIIWGATTASILDANGGTGNIVRGNKGYVTENSGSAIVLSGNIAVIVTHGLATTPTFISLTGTQAEVKDCIATSVGATYFTITASANVTDNRTVYWRATVGAGN